eukprot:jgi/Chrzof1/14441/Cz09g03030.t1
MSRVPVILIRLRQAPIYHQLQLEEALLRATTGNWLIINDGSRCPAIVMGISGKAPDLIHVPEAHARQIQVIKRFTGGGTVVVDHDTVFTALIMQARDLPHVGCFPVPIMRWTESFFAPAFSPYGNFCLRGHDYAFDDRKFGGNAQAITSKRWIHHTSFLWDYDPHNMALLKHPSKQPEYRQGRDHSEFIVRLKDYMPTKQSLVDGLLSAAEQQFDLQEVSEESASQAMSEEYLRGNKLIDLSEYLPADQTAIAAAPQAAHGAA